jgi:predicted acylesterase/phospholipase RssA
MSVLKWMFVRLPLAFSLPFALMSLWWMLSGFQMLDDGLAEPAARSFARFLESQLPGATGGRLASSLGTFLHAVLVIALFLIGFLIAYNAASFVNWILVALGLKPIPYADGPPQVPPPGTAPSDPLAHVNRIGLVLAGGGAKGAHQAGAMRAIYRFLAEHNALHKVKVISGTSIGSWNALFWLANLIKPAGNWDGRGVHEQWWRCISAKSLTAPIWYVPFLRNALLSSLPWQQVFDRIFDRPDVRAQLLQTDIHFYLTRSNVRSGQLECATNNPAPPAVAHVTYEWLDAQDSDRYLSGIKAGVFASMDMPPLFPYVERFHNLYEDGAVIDNLPITFAAASEENCDLIFILPLNSDFEDEPNTTSIVARLLRVMDVRQGALERSGFKMLYLYNELAALRRYVESARGARAEATGPAPLNFALHRKHELISVFAVCPLQSFVRQTIDARELWKRKQAGIAFEIMRDATAGLLPGFRFKPQDRVQVALVSREGQVIWDEKF